MTKVAIRFGDNDFQNTFTGVAKVLGESFKWNSEISDKEKILNIINLISYGCYIGFQSDKDDTFVDREKMTEYLDVDIDHLLLNEEVDEYIKTADDNHATIVLEYDNYTDTYYTYFI